MTDVAPSLSRVSPLRRTFGVLLLVLALALLVLHVLGFWNPWHLVVLTRLFGNPPRGVVLIAAAALLGSWLATPVRNEAVQRGRLAARVTGVVALVAALFCWGLLGTVFTAEVTVLARSPERAVALSTRTADDRELRVWAGRGIWARDVGSLGRACGEVTARFVGPDEVEVDSSFGTFRFALDPATGRPLNQLGPRCDGSG